MIVFHLLMRNRKKIENYLKKSQIKGIIRILAESCKTVRERKKKMATREKNIWILIVFILSGLVIGGLIGRLASNVQGLWWLSFEQEFGLKEPLVLDLSILKLTFALTFKINIASIIGMLISIFVYRKV